jgi:hypothetical protein
MRAPQLILVSLALIACLAFFAPGVRAATQTIAAGDHFDRTVTIDSVTDVWTYSWTSNVNLDFVVYDAAMTVVDSHTGTSYSSQISWSDGAGDYIVRWENTGASSAILTYSLTNPFGDVQHGISNIVTIGIITGVIIFVVILLVVFFVVMGGRKKQVSQPPMAGQVWAPPPVGGRCPTCGNTLVAGAKFCEKCGTRFG